MIWSQKINVNGPSLTTSQSLSRAVQQDNIERTGLFVGREVAGLGVNGNVVAGVRIATVAKIRLGRGYLCLRRCCIFRPELGSPLSVKAWGPWNIG